MKDVIHQTEDKMKKAIQATQRDFASVRTGRASAALLDRISVDYHGTDTPIKGLANISVPDGRTLQIQAYDRQSTQLIEKAIQKSDLGINPTNDGNVIRLVLPQLTQDRRKELVKQVHQRADRLASRCATAVAMRSTTCARRRRTEASRRRMSAALRNACRSSPTASSSESTRSRNRKRPRSWRFESGVIE